MSKGIYPIYVSYEEAQKLLPVFRFYAKQGPWRELRANASAIGRALEDVQDLDYGRLGGKQITLTEGQQTLYFDVRDELL